MIVLLLSFALAAEEPTTPPPPPNAPEPKITLKVAKDLSVTGEPLNVDGGCKMNLYGDVVVEVPAHDVASTLSSAGGHALPAILCGGKPLVVSFDNDSVPTIDSTVSL